jgi:hypothetical protein
VSNTGTGILKAEVMAKLVRWLWVFVLMAGLYSGWVLWQRHRAQAPRPAPVAVDPLAKYGSDVKILQFYTSTPTITKGSKALLCYSVINATGVRLDPPVERVWVSTNRCFEVVPERTTRYTLTADGADHKTMSETLEVVVR